MNRVASTLLPSHWTTITISSTPLSLTYLPTASSTSPLPMTCDADSSLTCSPCGVCSSNSTDASICIGMDGEVFGSSVVDCPIGTIEDRNGICCPEDQLNCAGFCSTWYVEAKDSTNTFPVCCFVDVGIMMMIMIMTMIMTIMIITRMSIAWVCVMDMPISIPVVFAVVDSLTTLQTVIWIV